MDVGIVFVIAVNAAVIGIAIDTPQHTKTWEIVEIVPRPHISVSVDLLDFTAQTFPLSRWGFNVTSQVFFSIYMLEFLVKNVWWGVSNYFCALAENCGQGFQVAR